MSDLEEKQGLSQFEKIFKEREEKERLRAEEEKKSREIQAEVKQDDGCRNQAPKNQYRFVGLFIALAEKITLALRLPR